MGDLRHSTRAAVELVRDGASQRLLIDLIAVTVAPAAESREPRPVCTTRRHSPSLSASAPPQPLTTPLSKQLQRRLIDWLDEVVADAARFDELDATSRHRLRKHIKRLRYGAEMASGLLGRKATRKALKTLRGAQDALGELNDLQTATGQLRRGTSARSPDLVRARLAAGTARCLARRRLAGHAPAGVFEEALEEARLSS